MRVSPPRLLILALVVAACDGGRGGDSTARAADTARPVTAPAAQPAAQAAASVPHADSSGAAVGSPAAGVSLASAGASDTLCVRAAARAGRALKIAFTRDSGSAFSPPLGSGPPWIGCRVEGAGTLPPSTPVAAMPEGKLRAAMRGTGWTEDLNYQASGPEGSAFALRRGQALCNYDVLFPGSPGDDDGEIDSAVVPDTTPAPRDYIVHILCTPGVPPRGP